MVAQQHHLLLEQLPGGAKRFLSAAKAKQILVAVRPRDAAGKVRRRFAAVLIADLERSYRRKKPPTRSSPRSSGQPAPACWTSRRRPPG